MKVKPISYKELKSNLLADPEVNALYQTEKRADELQELLQQMRAKAGLNSRQVAELMGISQPAVSKLERNASRASVNSLQRYAQACGTNLTFNFS
ncbi:helix-turn-helix transcriptional regulator [Pasteurellaceae bacterium USgator11]|nr:helix-turn-helix transcriptional regulator [Pasteurellaceae bacterium UScroc12]TNG94884.1 helix-turn-helix transcriptional regulator [Pasteurellaceae bacterium USgator41]TNH00432.1 helix-turn-helix transcriptional regulator [Pasteurellaceae bacterium UScroc31]TNH01737.1 helix-turn-helix transcriptional regulator [Pasteurellaceae bacterium USgator11]